MWGTIGKKKEKYGFFPQFGYEGLKHFIISKNVM